MFDDIILLIIERIQSAKAKMLERQVRLGPKQGFNMSSSDSESKLGKLKAQVFALRFTIGVKIVSTVFIIFLVLCLMMTFVVLLVTVGSVTSLGTLSGGVTKDDKDTPGVIIDSSVNIKPTIPSISGGLKPKDKVLKSRAILLDIIATASNASEAKTGVYVDPAWILGTIYRESGNSMYDRLDSSEADMLSELIILNPACAQGKKCRWIQNGISHYVGGSVINGVDTGDPHTQKLETSMEIYTKYDYDSSKGTVINGGHAVGIVQFEIPYVYNNFGDLFPLGDYKNISKGTVAMDSQLGFLRPNPFYVPDVLQGCVTLQAHTNYSNPSNCSSHQGIGVSKYSKIFESKNYKNLDKRNQDFIKFMYAAVNYGRGHIHATEDEMAYELIRIVEEGKIQYLDEMLLPVQSSYYNSSKYYGWGAWADAERYMIDTYGINIPVGRTSWVGVWAACVGRCIYNGFIDAINNSEKEDSGLSGVNPGSTSGNQVGYVGSGMWNSVGNYYSQKMGCTIFEQVNAETKYSTFPSEWADNSWGDLTLDPSSGNTMAFAGCGIYSLAFCATNLYGKMYDPAYCRLVLDQAINEEIEKGTLVKTSTGSRKVEYTDYLPGMLSDMGVALLAKSLGLEYKIQYYTVSDEQFEENVINELKKGNLILGAWNGTFEWYSGTGHFMVIRGYNNIDNKLRVYTSYALGKTESKTIEGIGQIELDAATVKKHFSSNRSYYWVIGLKGNVN